MSKEILYVVEAVSNEKGVAKEAVFKAVEAALASIAKKNREEEVNIRVAVDRETGDYETFRQWAVVSDTPAEDTPINPSFEMPLSEAKKIDSELEIGDIIEEPIESIGFGRIAAQHAKQVIMRELRLAEREEIAKKYKDKVGTLVIGIVKSVTRDYLIINMGDNAEAILPHENLIPRDAFREGDRVRGILKEVRTETKGPQLVIDRTCPEMLAELFRIEVPEINEDVIEIKAVARDPGSRAKMAVKTNDGRIDPIGACIGIRGSRVQAVSSELNGERIDIILWDDDPAQLVVNSLALAEISSIVQDEQTHSMDIAVKEDQLAQAIGRSGQNIQLASKLSGWTLNVMTEEEIASKSKEKTSDVISLFAEKLDVEESLAEVLVEAGFNSMEDVAYSPAEELLEIEEFDAEIVAELQNRAKNALLSEVLAAKEQVGTVEPTKELLELPGMTRHLAYTLASRGVVTREDLAELSVDDLDDIKDLDKELAAKLIMAARAPWFE